MRASNDLESLGRFLESYECYGAGAEHRLVILLKGFGAQLPAAVRELLNRAAHSELHCPDRGYDAGSYFYAAQRLGERLVMFTNSFSILRADLWLAKMLDAYHAPGVGLVGATGSWESLSSHYLNQRVARSGSRPRRIAERVRTLALGIPLLALFPAFPNVHVRTNGFLLARTDFLAARPKMMRTKLDAWMFESGRYSLTRRITSRGLEVRVVGRDGTVYQPQEWARSMTFWQCRQENLLVQDNRTMAYERGSAQFQANRYWSAWDCRPG